MRTNTLFFLFLLFCGACASEGDLDDGYDDEGKLSTNGLELHLEAVELLSIQPLTSNLDSSQLNEDVFGALLKTDYGKQLLSYIVKCALEEGESIVVKSTQEVLKGNLGLAPLWAKGECNQSCQRWVSACLLAHTNASGESVRISLRGSNPALNWSTSPNSKFQYQEAAFYGNLFLPTEKRVLLGCNGFGFPRKDIQTNSRRENGRLILENVSLTNQSEQGRICGNGKCGFIGHKFCSEGITYQSPNFPDSICSQYDEGQYASCATNEQRDQEFMEVITVYTAFQQPMK